MICPMLTVGSFVGKDCLEKDCAWWQEGGGCAIAWIPVWLQRLASKV
jgi:hypothetical protein